VPSPPPPLTWHMHISHVQKDGPGSVCRVVVAYMLYVNAKPLFSAWRPNHDSVLLSRCCVICCDGFRAAAVDLIGSMDIDESWGARTLVVKSAPTEKHMIVFI